MRERASGQGTVLTSPRSISASLRLASSIHARSTLDGRPIADTVEQAERQLGTILFRKLEGLVEQA